MSGRRLRSIAGGAAGNVLEWFDFLTYSVFAIYFSKAFFPGDSMTVRLMNAAAIAAVGYVARPLGSWLIGVLADRRGRRQALGLSVAMMSLGSFVIALTPGYASIGVAAPAILLAARLLQGFSMGGEAGTSATYLAEMAPAGRRGFFVGFVQVTVVFGQLLALGLLLLLQYALLTPAQLDAWGWRIPFVIGGVLAVFALVLRRGIDETAAFTHQHELGHELGRELGREPGRGPGRKRGPNLLRVLAGHRRAVLISAGMSIGGSVEFYTFTVYAQKFMVNTTGFGRDRATLIATVALTLYMLWQPLFGFVSDLIGRKPVMLLAGIGGTLLTVPIMSALGVAQGGAAALLLNLAGLLVLSGFSSIHWLVKSELFPTEVRALGVGLPFAVVSSVMGGSTEWIALRLKAAGHEPWFFLYVSACAAVSLAAYVAMPETRDRSALTADPTQVPQAGRP